MSRRTATWSCAKTTAISALLLAACSKEQPATFDPFTAEFGLAQETQKLLWDVEQRAFLLANRVAPRMVAALKAGNASAFESFFSGDFQCTWSTGPKMVNHGPVRELSAGPADRRTDRRALAETLIRSRVTRVHFEDLAPVDRTRLGGAWRGTVRFQAIREGFEATTVMELDYARISREPETDRGWIVGGRLKKVTVHQCAKPLFVESPGHGIDTSVLVDRWGFEKAATPAGASLASFFLDYDRDGNLDLLLCDRKVFLYRGKGDGTFENATKAAGLPTRSSWLYTGGTVLDCDNDGGVDLLLQAVKGAEGRSEVWKNNGDGTFVKLDVQIGFAVANGAVADFDNDGLADVYFANAGAPPPERRARWIGDETMPHGVLLRNRGGFRFEDVTAKANAGGGYRDIFAAQWMDIDGDGDPDLFLANHMGDNPLLLNNGDGTFTESKTVEGFGGFSMGLATGDLDGDGDPDAYLANMSSFAGTRIVNNLRAGDFPPGVFELVKGFVDGNYFYRNDNGRFTRVALQETGWAYGPSLADFDGDGMLDLYCPAGFQSVKPQDPDG